ncbi:molybdenum cofactor biosynthesis protein B [Candidatus Enterovibrio escicola]|uniref:Molybdenum cofactor biosynthesis protein B n=1 Tax=Candidatus Enterovibrio escicola TaxID=1927127 RepID=A0A2A5T461_9GAMM|nr:molybdenum cofactor biosynthesis protein B [Candidatus Enterovibrio escacola]PCS22957.1 Molybdenum cofactor biosynthesis protein MoaB [Candidatus Enterovibrio escacola]
MGQDVIEFMPANIAVLTVSDTRTEKNDRSGQFLVNALQNAGHSLVDKKIVIDNIYQIRAIISQWVAEKDIQAILITGGTGFTSRDCTPEAIKPLFDKEVEGFGELFRTLSFQEIGTSTIQSRAVAGFANHTIIFAMPGSTDACSTGWNGIINQQMNARHRPCNFMLHINV